MFPAVFEACGGDERLVSPGTWAELLAYAAARTVLERAGIERHGVAGH